jgi:methylated-DNA-protein-cysteine methyltransferase-like protein
MCPPKLSLSQSIIKVIKNIPRGKVATYGQIAMIAGNPNHVRHVVWILHSQSNKENLPWHRVINSKGKISLRPGEGFERQKLLLEKEGINFMKENQINLVQYLWNPGGIEFP